MTDQHPHEGPDSGPTQNISDQAVEQLSSATVYDSEGEKVGSVGQLYLGDNSGKPSWVTVKSGFFGMRESVVPMSGAQVNGDEIHVPYTKDHIKAAPHVEADGHLSPEEEQELHRHYGLESGRSGGSGGESEDARRHEGDLEHHPHGHGGHRHGQDIEADQEVSGQAHREHHEHHDKYASEAPRHAADDGVAGDGVARDAGPADRSGRSDGETVAAAYAGHDAHAEPGSAPSSDTPPSYDDRTRHAGEAGLQGRRVSDLDEVVDGGYGVGSAAPIHDGAQPLGHPIRAWRDTMSFREDAENEGEREPDVWFLDEQAAYNAGYHPAD